MIEIKNLSRYYDDFPALKNVSFDIKKGEVVAILGLNGAGKTTCLRVLTGFLSPSQGVCKIDGIDVFSDPVKVKSRIGYLPESPPLYQELNVEDYLHFVARLRGIDEKNFPKEFLRVITLAGLEQAKKALIRKLSLGYRKRVGIAQALIGSPAVLIFDEPISGLDPVQIVGIRNLISELSKKHTILISSHILSEVARACTRVLILHKGELVGDLSGRELEDLEERFMQLTATPVLEVGGTQ